ncbi:baseplate J/gp47 family protein [Desulfocastanea catecholica]
MSIDRLDLIRASTTLTGIDFVQVAPNQTEIFVFFHHDTLPVAVRSALVALVSSDFAILGEGQVDPPQVSVAQNVTPMPSFDGREVLHLIVDAPGGFGYYRLHIESAAIDPYYNDLRFNFKVNCSSDLDCKTQPRLCSEDLTSDFPVDYRARDFWSFRQALLDFAAQRYPDWQDRLEADLGMVLVELLSALGDEFSYAQDRLAREAYLDSATQRRSLRHLARWVDYAIDNGHGAFAWIDVTAIAPGVINGGTLISDEQAQTFFEFGRGLNDRDKGFAVSTPNELSPHGWDENDTCLIAGSRQLTLQGAHAASFVPDPTIDPVGKWVLLQTVPTDAALPVRRLMVRVVDAKDQNDPLLAQPITLIRWDAPTPFDLDLDTLNIRLNLLPATSGKTIETRFRIGPAANPADPDAHLPQAIERVGINSSFSYDNDIGRVKTLFSLADSDQTPLVWINRNGQSRPEIELIHEGDGPWPWVPSMVGEETVAASQKAFTLEDGLFRRVIGFERMGHVNEFVDYASSNGSTIRFGDNEFGLAPAEGSKFTVRYRLGNGRLMNVAPETLTHFALGLPAFVGGISNPLAATLGRDAESDEQVRVNAPQSFRALTYRAVRPEDYAAISKRLPWVQQSGASMRWTGSWSSVFVTPDSLDEANLSPAHRIDLQTLMDRVRQAGREVKVLNPKYANIDLEIEICVACNAYLGEVKEAVLLVLFGVDGKSGFFDPDNFTFGKPLSRSALIAAIQNVSGVKAVEQMRVRRHGWFDWRDFIEFELTVGMNEIVRIANYRDWPGRGSVKLMMEGGA